jgi:hypothetical protein
MAAPVIESDLNSGGNEAEVVIKKEVDLPEESSRRSEPSQEDGPGSAPLSSSSSSTGEVVVESIGATSNKVESDSKTNSAVDSKNAEILKAERLANLQRHLKEIAKKSQPPKSAAPPPVEISSSKKPSSSAVSSLPSADNDSLFGRSGSASSIPPSSSAASIAVKSSIRDKEQSQEAHGRSPVKKDEVNVLSPPYSAHYALIAILRTYHQRFPWILLLLALPLVRRRRLMQAAMRCC